MQQTHAGSPRPTGVATLVTPARRRRSLRRILAATDAAIIAAASLFAYVLRDLLGDVTPLDSFANEIPIAVAAIPLWLGVLAGVGAYQPYHFASGSPGVRRFLAGAIASVVALGFASFLFNLQLSRIYVVTLFVIAALLGSASRLIVRHRLRRAWHAGRGVQNTLIVGVNEESLAVAEAILRHPEAGYRLVGFIDASLPAGWPVLDGFEVVGSMDAPAVEVARRLGAGLVVVSPTAVSPGTLGRLTVALEGSEIDLAIAPSLFEVVTGRVTVEAIDNVPILQVEQVRLEGFRAALKRTVDVVGAAGLLMTLWPMMAAAALAVRIDSPGPALFRQARVGRDGRPFTILKFRTMITDAENRLTDVRSLNEAGHHFFKIRRDPRVTRVGRFLRKWSIDETPQLWNVLRGDMSLVGPRPPLPGEVARYDEWHLRRLRVRPGVTGLWQVSGRSDVAFDEAVRLDVFYIENWSLGLDLAILARTVRAVFGADGAY